MAAVGLIPDPAWALVREGAGLVVHGGADLRYAIPGVPDQAASELASGWCGGLLDRRSLSPRAAEVLDQLVLLGALGTGLGPGREPAARTVRVVCVGPPLPGLDAALASAGLEGAPGAALTLVLRTSGALAAVAQVAADLSGPYLFVDAAYHHTVSLGPLVLPGQTACLSCLAGRVASGWGDPEPPPEPGATKGVPVVAALVAHEVAKAAAGDNHLVSRTVALDLATWRVVEETVLWLPWCGLCGQG